MDLSLVQISDMHSRTAARRRVGRRRAIINIARLAVLFFFSHVYMPRDFLKRVSTQKTFVFKATRYLELRGSNPRGRRSLRVTRACPHQPIYNSRAREQARCAAVARSLRSMLGSVFVRSLSVLLRSLPSDT